MDEIVKPEYIPLLDKIGVAPGQREQYIRDLLSIINARFDSYFAELDAAES